MKIIALFVIFTWAAGSFGIQIPERHDSLNIGTQDLNPSSEAAARGVAA